MEPNRKIVINGIIIEEYYWNRNLVVYVNNRKVNYTYEFAVKAVERGLLK